MIIGVTLPHLRYSTPKMTQDRVAEEPAEPLVQVIRAADHCGQRYRLARRPAELVQAAQQVAEDQYLFEDPVLRRVEDEYGDPPPDGGQVLRHHIEADPEVERRYVEREPG